MPKRRGYLIEKVADIENLKVADKEAQKGKHNRAITRHNAQADADLKLLQHWILNPEEFPDPGFSMMEVHNDTGNKTRQIGKQKYFPWRILPHAIMLVAGQDIWKNLIADSFACVPGKGLHFGVKRMKMMLRRYPEYKWFWKTDYKKYYQSIPHDVVMAAFSRRFKDKRFLKLIEVAILNYDSGQEIIDILNDEIARKERCRNRRLHKPADRQLCQELD